MGIIDQEPVLADCYGVPSFFITDIVAESAGGGCVRLYGCVKQRGVLVPQYQVVMPHTAVLTCSRIASAAALAALKEEMVGAVAH